MNFIATSLLVAPPRGARSQVCRSRAAFFDIDRKSMPLATRMLADLALAGGDLAHPPLRLGCVGNREAGEESHDRLLSDSV